MDIQIPGNLPPPPPQQPTSRTLSIFLDSLTAVSLLATGYYMGATAQMLFDYPNDIYPQVTIYSSLAIAVGSFLVIKSIIPTSIEFRTNERNKLYFTLLKSVVDFLAGFLLKFFLEKTKIYKPYSWLILAAQAAINSVAAVIMGRGFVDVFSIFGSGIITVLIYCQKEDLEALTFTGLGIYLAAAVVVGVFIHYKPQFGTAGSAQG